MYPAFLPMTSMTEQRLWDSVVSRTMSTICMTVLTAVSKPIVRSVQEMSLSMVPGMPTQLMPL